MHRSLHHALLLAALICLAAVSCAEETIVLFDGSGANAWDTARDQGRLSREFSLSELSQTQAPAALQWRFNSRQQSYNDIFLRKQTPGPFDAFRVRLRNLGPKVTIACKVADAGGAEWTANTIPVEEDADWQWLEYPWDAWKIASWSRDPDGQMDFPLAYFTLIAFDVKAGVVYDLQVSEVQVTRPDPPVATITDFRFPTELNAGDEATLSFRFSLDKPCRTDRAYFSLRSDKADMVRVPLALPTPLTEIEPGRVYGPITQALRVHPYAFGGHSSAVLKISDAHIFLGGKLADQEAQAVTIHARKPGKTTASVREHNGVPTLFINEEPHNGMAYTAYRPGVQVFADFTQAGVNLYSFSATPTEAGYGLSHTAWVAPNQYDFSQLDERVLMVLKANPDAYIFPRLYIHAPKWWSEENPDEIVMMDRGDGTIVPFIHSGGKPAPAWKSEKWRKATVEALKRLIAHVEASPYADRIIGYHIASGTTEEWMMWGANENQWVGYSPANIKAFRAWLRGKYETDEALQRAWGAPGVTLDDATVPLKTVRGDSRFGALRDPRTEQQSIDFYIYNSEMVADTINYFARAVKDITNREKTVGVFYGYLLQLCGEQRQQNAGHLGLENVLASPDVDFLCSPTSYAFRQLGGEGTSHFMSLQASIKLHGKLWFDENDIRTSLSPGSPGGWGKPQDIAGDILQQDKELADVLVNGAAQWWFDVGGNRYNDPGLMAHLGELVQEASAALPLDRSPVDEVAFVVDETSLAYLKVGHPLGRWLLIGQLPALHRIGAPVGHYLTEDLPRIADRKVFIIPTSFAPDAAQRDAIDALKRDGHMLIFLHTPGLYRDGEIDEAAMSEFTGITLRLSREPSALKVTLDRDAQALAGVRSTQYGVDSQVAPVCYADDPRATVLGRLPDGRPGLVMRDHGEWTAVHSSAPLLPADLLRALARRAGVHCYIDTQDVVWACRDMLAVCVNAPGERTIHLPRAKSVKDLSTGQTIAVDTTQFRENFGEKATRVFVVK